MAFDSLVARWMERAIGFRVSGWAVRSFTKYSSARKLRNLLLINRELNQGCIAPAGYPFVLTVDPTNVCNLRCPLCPTGAREFGRPKGKMTLEQFRIVIDQIGDYLYGVALFHFGEPLLNSDVPGMVEYAHRHNIATSISSNFTVVTKEMTEALVKSQLDHLKLSIDGLSPESYCQYRVGGSFEKVIENVKMLVETRKRLHSHYPVIEWQFLVFKHNCHEAAKVKEFVKSLGIDKVTVMPGNAGTDIKNRDERSQYVLSREERSKYAKTPQSGRICNFLWYTFTVNYDGGVAPCCFAYEQKDDFGNFFLEIPQFKAMWNNDRFKAARAIFRQARLPAGEDIICNECIVAKEYVQESSFGEQRWLRRK